MKPLLAVMGPRDAGPGERMEMLRQANALLEQSEIDDVERFDIPGRAGAESGDGLLRVDVERLVPALQSGSLFGGRRGVLVVDAHNLLAGEAQVIAGLAESLDGSTTVLALVSDGALPRALGAVVKRVGEITTVRKMRERDAAGWLANAAREHRVRLSADGIGALVQRFGSDIAAMDKALDQLENVEGEIGGAEIAERFRNRPDEPMWHYADAVADGDVGQALRRLSDFLVHGHPLQLLAFLQHDLRRRSLAAAADDIATFAEWAGASPEQYPIKKAWQQRSKSSSDDLRRAVDAIARADLVLKGEPEPTHRLTMERLTVALCRWYGGRRRVG